MISPQENITKKPEEKRPRTSKKEEEWTEDPMRTERREKEHKPGPREL